MQQRFVRRWLRIFALQESSRLSQCRGQSWNLRRRGVKNTHRQPIPPVWQGNHQYIAPAPRAIRR